MEETNKYNLPDVENLKKFFDSFINKKRKINKEELKAIYHYISFVPRFIHYHDESNFKFYRARPAEDVKQDITLVSTFSHAPHNKASMDRANIKGHPVLYTSLNELTSLIESKCKNYFYVGVWKIKKDTTLKLNSLLFTDIDKDNPFSMVSRESFKNAEKYFTDFTTKQKEQLYKIYKLFSDLFLQDNKIITSLIGYKILYQPASQEKYKPDALIYPSIRIDKKDCNIAFHPDFVKDHLQLKYVVFGHINNNINNQVINTTIENIGINFSNKIKWYRYGINFNNVIINPEKENKVLKSDDLYRYYVDIFKDVKLLNLCLDEISNRNDSFRELIQNIEDLCKKKNSKLADNFKISDSFTLIVNNKFGIYSDTDKYQIDSLMIDYFYKFKISEPHIN